jgi:hypothetical protein
MLMEAHASQELKNRSSEGGSTDARQLLIGECGALFDRTVESIDVEFQKRRPLRMISEEERVAERRSRLEALMHRFGMSFYVESSGIYSKSQMQVLLGKYRRSPLLGARVDDR